MIGLSFIYPQYLWLLLLIPLTIGLALIGRRSTEKRRLWGGLALRSAILALITLALSGIQLRLPTNSLTTVFVIDASDSISSQEQARAEDWVRDAIAQTPRGDQSAIVIFGEDALVERLAEPDSTLGRLTSNPITTRTDIAAALQLGMALFPDEGARRLVLLSDGRENLDYALQQAELAAMQEIQLEYHPLGEEDSDTEVLIDAMEAPADVREGQNLELAIVVRANTSVNAILQVFADGELFQTQAAALRSGANRFVIPIEQPEQGFHRYRAVILPDADNRLQNNEASAFSVVHGPPSVLLVEGTPGDGKYFAQVLEEGGVRVSTVAPSAIPVTLAELARYDAVILANVPAAALPAGTMEALPVFVRELGKGLLMTGGDTSFGAGGYLRTPIEAALPVFMDVKSRELSANLALVLAVDKSGSMGRCHCDNPDLNQTYTAAESGQPKVDIAKEAIMRSAGALGPEDYLGVVAFDSASHWALDVQKLVDPGELETAISTFRAEGQTNLAGGVNSAYKALQKVDAKRKHVILLTDGWVHTGELTALAQQMRAEGITLSIIAAGEGSAQYLSQLAVTGGGTYYPAVDMMSVPDIFLKETVKSVGQYIIEKPTFAIPGGISPALRGIDTNDLPMLQGYNGTSIKGTSRQDLITDTGDPLLASWQYGLGRSAVWTSDLKNRWGANWVNWDDFGRFAAQTVAWLLPSPQVEGLTPRVSLQDNNAIVHLDAVDAQGRPLNFLTVQARLIAPDLTVREISLQQVGPGQYEAIEPVSEAGAYLLWIGTSDREQPMGQMTLGLAVPYSPEYRAGGLNEGFLNELAAITGGGLLEEPLQAFIHNLPSAAQAREISQTLLLIAALLFPLDVALRRLILQRSDWQKIFAWITSPLKRRSNPQMPGAEAPRELGRLFSARARARDRVPDKADEVTVPKIVPVERTQPDEAKPPVTPTGDGEDSLARLRAAKKRASTRRQK